MFICVCLTAGLAKRNSLAGIQLTTSTCTFSFKKIADGALTMRLYSIMLTMHLHLAMYWLDNARI